MPRHNIQEEATIVRDKSTGKLVFWKIIQQLLSEYTNYFYLFDKISSKYSNINIVNV